MMQLKLWLVNYSLNILSHSVEIRKNGNDYIIPHTLLSIYHLIFCKELLAYSIACIIIDN